MPAQKAPQKDAGQNGAVRWGNTTDAATYEEDIARRAAEIRGDEFKGLDRAMFIKLWPLLREPLHAGHVTHTPVTTGKPYVSDGASSAQVLVDRMNNVLTPLGWESREEYAADGKLCKVTVVVLDIDGHVLVTRSSWGGVAQGMGAGNIYKGSWTNAAKLAFARLGPGREVYLGALDFDPDTNAQIAALQGRQSKERTARNGADSGEGTVQQTTTPAEALAALLAEAGLLQAKRAAVNAAFDFAQTELGREVAAGQRLRELQGAPDERTLDELLARINDYVSAEVDKRENEAS
jgi:hypothetical protein